MFQSVQFNEDKIYRHLEPALAFQLELNRMSAFDLKPIPCTNHNLHLYYGSAKKVVKKISFIVGLCFSKKLLKVTSMLNICTGKR